MDERALVDAARVGDARALEVLLGAHVDRLHFVCRRILVDDQDALDATQEALIAIARAIPNFDGRAAFSTWSHRIAVNAALDELRRRKRRPRPVEDLPEPGDASAIAAVDARLDVDAALARLDDDFRLAVVLRDLCDLDYAEIATATGVPIGTVRSRIARGRAALAAMMREPEHPSGPSK